MTLARIDSGLRGLRTNAANRRANVQTIGLLIIAHAMEHGDCSRAAALARILPTSERSQLALWFQRYSPISVRVGKTAADDKSSLRKQDNAQHNTWNMEGAIANPWHTVEKPAVDTELLTLEGFSGKLAASLISLAKNVDTKVTEEDREAARALAGALNRALVDLRAAPAVDAFGEPRMFAIG